MSSTVRTETKQNSTTPQKQNNTIPKNTKKKKKKKPVLYQETAVKYFDGFMKNKRYKKGIKLSTGCAILKIAWELPENNGLILPSRVIRHIKQVLPKKPKQSKKKNHKKDSNQDHTEKDLIRSRTMMQISGINTLNHNALTPNHQIATQVTQQLRRSIIVTAHKNKEEMFDDNIEAAIDNKLLNENSAIIPQKHVHILSKSVDNLSYNLSEESVNIETKLLLLAASDTTLTPDVSDIATSSNMYPGHADIRMEDMKQDIEETAMLVIHSETDLKYMHDEKKQKKSVKKKKKKKTNAYDAHDTTKLFTNSKINEKRSNCFCVFFD